MDAANGKIMVIQSDPAVRDLMALTLTGAGYPVCALDDLRQALPALREDPPRLILVDLFLKDSVGLDSLYHVRKETQATGARVIVVSALCFREIVQVAVRAGACDFVAKPVNPADLVQRVQRAMAQGVLENARPLDAVR
jgi:DNA-binding response OmpR family regulator